MNRARILAIWRGSAYLGGMEAIKRFFVWLMGYVHEGAFLSRFSNLFHRSKRAKIVPVNPPVPPPSASPADIPVVVRQYEEHPSEAYMELKYRFRDIGRLKAIAETMGRDFLTAMPEGAWRSRLGQIAYLHRLVHEKLTGTDMKRLFDRAREHLGQNPGDWDEWDSANLRGMAENHECDGALTGDIVERRARLEYEGRRRHRDALAQSDWPGAR
jgi:hypothetical protein